MTAYVHNDQSRSNDVCLVDSSSYVVPNDVNHVLCAFVEYSASALFSEEQEHGVKERRGGDEGRGGQSSARRNVSFGGGGSLKEGNISYREEENDGDDAFDEGGNNEFLCKWKEIFPAFLYWSVPSIQFDCLFWESLFFLTIFYFLPSRARALYYYCRPFTPVSGILLLLGDSEILFAKKPSESKITRRRRGRRENESFSSIYICHIRDRFRCYCNAIYR